MSAHTPMSPIRLGVPRSVRHGDNRVSMSPKNVRALLAAVPIAWSNGTETCPLEILVERDAGRALGYADDQYTDAGASVVSRDALLQLTDVLFDVKQRPADQTVKDGVNVFYSHIEKGHDPALLRALVRHGVTLYSPETIFLPTMSHAPARGVNLGYYAGVGGVHLAFEGVRRAHAICGIVPALCAQFPDVTTATAQDITAAYATLSAADRAVRVGIIGSQRGLVARGAFDEFQRAGITPGFLDRTITSNPAALAAALAPLDIIVHATVWEPGLPRIIGRRELLAMKEGAVFIDVSCDPDHSSNGTNEGVPVHGAVRFTVESTWGDPHHFYWVGPDRHTAFAAEPLDRNGDDLRVLYCANGMIPGGRSIAAAASDAYFAMMLPYVLQILRCVAMDVRLPTNGLVLHHGYVVHAGLRDVIATTDALADLRTFC